jgi:hypothetical protein
MHFVERVWGNQMIGSNFHRRSSSSTWLKTRKDLSLQLYPFRDISKTSIEKYECGAIYHALLLMYQDGTRAKKHLFRPLIRSMSLIFCESLIQSYGFPKHVRQSAFLVSVRTIPSPTLTLLNDSPAKDKNNNINLCDTLTYIKFLFFQLSACYLEKVRIPFTIIKYIILLARFWRVMTKLNQNESAKSVPSFKHRRSIIKDSFLLNDLEDIFLVWLDTNIDRNDDCIETEVELRRRFNSCLKTFTDADHCIDFLRSFTSDQSQIILIVSGSLESKLLLQVHEFHAIISSYIFCSNEVLHIDWAKNFSKVKGIFTSKTALLEKLSIDHTLYSIKKTPIHK